MAKKSPKAADEFPGIYEKRQPIPLKIGSETAKTALRNLASQSPWTEWFATIGPWLENTASSDDSEIAPDSQRAYHLWQWCSERVKGDLPAQKLMRNAIELGKLLERIQIKRLGAEELVKLGRQHSFTQGNRNQGKLSEVERQSIKSYIAARVKVAGKAKPVCEEVVQLLARGEFKGIPRKVTMNVGTIQNLWSKRNLRQSQHRVI